MKKKGVSRRQFLTGAAALGATAVIGCELAKGETGREGQTNFLPRILSRRDASQLNFITIMFDTLRYDHVGFLGNDWIQTPNIDAFAAQSQVFDRVYAGGFPTILNRAELFTGRYMYTVLWWEDLPLETVVLADMMSQAGYTTGIVFDTLHLKDQGFFLDRGFQSWDWVRGQENDRYRATPHHPPLPAAPSKFKDVYKMEQYLRNMQERQEESDYLVAQTLRRSVEWLERNKDHGPFYLHIDSFDPHEPWDPPQSYVDLYNPGYTGEEVIYPAYAPPDFLSAAELEHMRALYAAEITLVDAWFGHFLTELDNLGLADNTVVFLMSDHGFLLGEHNAVGKAWSRDDYYEAYPLYRELVHVPLMVRMPGMPHRRLDTLAQPADIMPTLLDLADADDPGTMHGISLRPFLEGEEGNGREAAVSGRSMQLPLSSKNRLSVTDGEWMLFHGAAHTTSHLYYLPDDPQQQNDLLDTECAIARRLHSLLIDFLEAAETPSETIDDWRPAPC